MRVRSTISEAVMKTRLNLVLDRSSTPQIWRLSTQVARNVATPELSLKVVSKDAEKQTHSECKQQD